MRYAEVDSSGTIVNVVEATEEWVAEQTDKKFVADPNAQANIGGAYQDGEFIQPAPPAS